jgi:hypothetical protein
MLRWRSVSGYLYTVSYSRQCPSVIVTERVHSLVQRGVASRMSVALISIRDYILKSIK